MALIVCAHYSYYSHHGDGDERVGIQMIVQEVEQPLSVKEVIQASSLRSELLYE